MALDPDAKLVANERLKLTAGYLNTAATGSLTVGVLGPLAAATYGLGGATMALQTLLIGGLIWFVGSTVLHSAARAVLRRLKA